MLLLTTVNWTENPRQFLWMRDWEWGRVGDCTSLPSNDSWAVAVRPGPQDRSQSSAGQLVRAVPTSRPGGPKASVESALRRFRELSLGTRPFSLCRLPGSVLHLMLLWLYSIKAVSRFPSTRSLLSSPHPCSLPCPWDSNSATSGATDKHCLGKLHGCTVAFHGLMFLQG